MTTLIMFNIETSISSKYLSANCDLIQNLAMKFDKVIVYSTHVGSYSFAPNVIVKELGGGSLIKKIRAVLRCYVAAQKIIRNRRDTVVLYHMVTAAPFLISYLLSLFKIKQALWYSHSIADRRLSVVLNNIDYVFTPTSDSFPIESSKVKVMGHGVDSGRFKYAQSSKRFGVISTGRIVPVKRIELFIEAFSNLDQVSRDYFKILTLVGDDTIDPDYVEFLKSIAREKQLDLRIVGQVSRSELPSFLNASDFYYMGTPKSLDKSAIEAAMCGCILICDSQSSLSSVGLSSNVIKSGDDSKLAIVKLMNQYLKFDVQRIRELQFETAIYSANNNDIGKLSQRIYDTFRND